MEQELLLVLGCRVGNLPAGVVQPVHAYDPSAQEADAREEACGLGKELKKGMVGNGEQVRGRIWTEIGVIGHEGVEGFGSWAAKEDRIPYGGRDSRKVCVSYWFMDSRPQWHPFGRSFDHRDPTFYKRSSFRELANLSNLPML